MLYTCQACGRIGPARWCPEHKPKPQGNRFPRSSTHDRELQKRFRAAVLERDRHRCTRCGATRVPLVAAHLTPVRAFPAGAPEAYDPSNGTTLCEPCHRATDRYARIQHPDPAARPAPRLT